MHQHSSGLWIPVYLPPVKPHWCSVVSTGTGYRMWHRTFRTLCASYPVDSNCSCLASDGGWGMGGGRRNCKLLALYQPAVVTMLINAWTVHIKQAVAFLQFPPVRPPFLISLDGQNGNPASVGWCCKVHLQYNDCVCERCHDYCIQHDRYWTSKCAKMCKYLGSKE